MQYRCDIEFLERRTKILKRLNYGILIPSLIALYFKPSVFIVNDSLTVGLAIWAVTMCVLRFTERHYGDALCNHASDMVTVNNSGLEFCHQDSGYNFKRNNEEIVSVEYSSFLGTPKIKLRFINNEFYDLVWFKDSKSLYTELKHKEDLVQKA
ncbi:conserved hypothetical protein [Vibrio aestuarianus]|nr:conserved hypothetical protein [Vibrio aestuarianus]